MKTKTEAEFKEKFQETEIGTIPEGWEVRKVGDFVDIKHGYAFKGEFFTDAATENVVLTPGNFNIGGGFKAEKFKYTHEEIPAEYVLNEGDVIVTMTDLSKQGDTLGYAAKVPHDTIKRFLHNQRLGLLIFRSGISKDFLYWVLRTRSYNQFVVGSASGSTVKHTSPDRIKQYPFEIPTNQLEQNRIADILSALDSKIELDQRINKNLETIGRAIFRHWLVDFEFPNKEGKPYKSSGGKLVFDEELGMAIPVGWLPRKLNEISKNFDSRRVPLSSRERETRRGVYPYYGAAGVLDYVDDFLFDGTFVLMGEDGSVIDEAGHPILQYVWGRFWVNNHAHVLQGYDISNELLYLLLTDIKVDHIVTGAVQPKINQNNMNKLAFALPPPEILMKLERVIEPLFGKLRTITKEIETLTDLRDSLLPKLMSGKIRVPVEVR